MVCPVVPAIIALVLAGNAQRNIDASGGALDGEGLVKAARVISWVHLALAALVLVVVILGVVVAASSSSS